jgi:hypothetical protein
VSIQAEATIAGRPAGLADCEYLLDQRIRDAGQFVLYGSHGELLGAATVDRSSLTLDKANSGPPVIAVCDARWALPSVPEQQAYRVCTSGVSSVVSHDQLAAGSLGLVINYNGFAYTGTPAHGCTGGH